MPLSPSSSSRKMDQPLQHSNAAANSTGLSPAQFTLFSTTFDQLPTPRTPTRLILASPAPSTPANNNNFNPDDFFASPPTSRHRATPECKRRLFLDTLAASPAGSFLTFGQFDTPRVNAAAVAAIGASGRKRGRQRFPSDTFSIAPSASANASPSLFISPGRLPPPSLLLNSPGKSSIGVTNTPANSIPTSTNPVAVDSTTGSSNRGNTSTSAATNNNATAAVPNANVVPATSNGINSTSLPISTTTNAVVPNATTPLHIDNQNRLQNHHRQQQQQQQQSNHGQIFQTPHNNVQNTSKSMFLTPITPADNMRPTSTKCSCKASKCLKLYCPCFAASTVCAPSCSCKNCSNNEQTKSSIDEARRTVLLRDPKAFDPKVRTAASTDTGIHSKGCNCRKGCAKNYCVCRELSVACGPRCTCSGPRGCMNGKDNGGPCADDGCAPGSKSNLHPQQQSTSFLRPAQLPHATSVPAMSRELKKVTQILSAGSGTTRKRLPIVSVDALRIDDDEDDDTLPIPGFQLDKENMDAQDTEFFKSLRAAAAPPNATLFPPATPERLKADVLALASSPATRSPRVRFARREPPSGAARPPRILRVKMGSGRGLRKFAIGGATD